LSFRLSFLPSTNQVSGAISEYLSRADSKWIIELAAGGGGASAQWTDMLRATDHPECKLLLTGPAFLPSFLPSFRPSFLKAFRPRVLPS
jgi:hypothetical protein